MLTSPRLNDRRPRLARTAGAAVASILLLGACGGGATTEEPTGTAQEPDAGGGGTQVSIVDNAFEPSEVEVAAGSTVAWENTGSNPHTVTFEDGEDSGTLDSGATYSRTFDEAGEFPYACTIHPSMEGTVTVTG